MKTGKDASHSGIRFRMLSESSRRREGTDVSTLSSMLGIDAVGMR
jgi:hypothetical protein